MPTTCSHGLPASECLICRTLATSTPDRPSRAAGGVGPAAGAGGGSPARVTGDRGGGPPARPGGSGGVLRHVAVVVAAIAAISVVIWLVTGVVSALLHVAEFIVVAAVAGWAGYRLGYFRGRRER